MTADSYFKAKEIREKVASISRLKNDLFHSTSSFEFCFLTKDCKINVDESYMDDDLRDSIRVNINAFLDKKKKELEEEFANL